MKLKSSPRVRLTALCVILLVTSGHSFALGGQVNAKLKKALLADPIDWEMVLTNCGPKIDEQTSPVVRAIAGHACLAINDNDAALLLFLSIKDNAAKRQWREWTENTFIRRANGAALARYFAGDALARQGHWPEAVKQYNAGLEPFEKSLSDEKEKELHRLVGSVTGSEKKTSTSLIALLYNARGVAKAESKDFIGALRDLKCACNLAPSFADARANLGTLMLLRRTSVSPRTLQYFEDALKLSNSNAFALARNGKACVLIAQGKVEEGQNIMLDLDSTLARGLAAANLDSFANAMAKSLLAQSDRDARENQENPGMSLSQKTQTLAKQIEQKITGGMKPNELQGYLNSLQGSSSSYEINMAAAAAGKNMYAKARENFVVANIYAKQYLQAQNKANTVEAAEKTLKGAGKITNQFGKVIKNRGVRIFGKLETAAGNSLGGITGGLKTTADRLSSQAQKYNDLGSKYAKVSGMLKSRYRGIYAMDKTSNPGFDVATARAMGSVSVNPLTKKVIVFSNDRTLAQQAKQGAIGRGIDPANIRIMPLDHAPRMAERSDPTVSNLLIRSPPGGTVQKPPVGGVDMDLSGGHRQGKLPWVTWFGLAQSTPLPMTSDDSELSVQVTNGQDVGSK